MEKNMNLSDAQKKIQTRARDLSLKELAPQAVRVDKERSFPLDGLNKLGAAGFLGLTIPKTLGGEGADNVSFALAIEAIAKSCASTALVFLTHSLATRALAVAGSDEQKQRLLPAMISGEKLGALALTEAASGSNSLAITTKAVADGDSFIVNGTKTLITGGENVDVYIVVLRTDGAKIPLDLSAIIIEKGTPGFSFGKKADFMGLCGASNGDLVFENCRVPRANLLGSENGYINISPAYASHAMLGMAAISLGIAQAAVNAATEHAKTRQNGGKPISSYQGIQFLIAEMTTALATSRELTYSAAQQLDNQQPPSPLPLYMAKLNATEMAIDVVNKALQVHGGTGYSRNLPLERYYRDARGLTLHFSTSEKLKEMVGKMLLGLPPL
ncbi:MAG: acyl-CoA dehydrogenase family protein [Candidatus Lokiarchaeota archaeon]